MAVAKSIFKSIFKGYSRGIAGSEGGIPGLLSLWNAKAPTVCPVGPQIQTSAAGNQPDADGNMGAWPVNHPGKGVMVQPAFTQMLQNSKFEGAVSGSPGTAPTNWPLIVATGSLVANGRILTYSAGAGARHISDQTVSVLANTKYYFTARINFKSSGTYANISLRLLSNPAGSTITVEIDGTVVDPATFTVTAGWHTVTSVLSVGATAGTVICRIGAGAGANLSSPLEVDITTPQFTANYIFPYAASGAGATTSVTSTAATSGGNGLEIALNAAMIAALSGGAFTAAALVEMGVSSAQVTAPANILSVNDVADGLIFADSGGKLKCTDGTNTAEVTVTGGWARTDELLPVVQCDGATFRTGYAKNTFTAITWGSAVAVGADGDWNVVTHERIGLNSVIPFGIQQTQFWGKSASEAEVLKVQGYAI